MFPEQNKEKEKNITDHPTTSNREGKIKKKEKYINIQ